MFIKFKNWKRLFGLTAILLGGMGSQAMVGKTKKIEAQKVEFVKGEYVVQMQKQQGASKALLKNQLAEVGMELKSTINAQEDLYLVKTKGGVQVNSKVAIHSLEKLSGVQFAEPNFIYRAQGFENEVIPSGPLFNKLWGMKNSGQNDPEGRAGIAGADISATKAWAITQGSKDIVVAVIDTGIDYSHPALKDNIWTKPKTSPSDPDVYGYNAITDVADPMDDHSHGTHCAGTIGASGANPDGVVGVTWNVRLMGVKFLSSSGSGTLADAIKAIDWATANGAQVMSNSWGGGGFSEALLDSIKRARDKGILFVAAAGNSTSNNDQNPSYPASYAVDNILAVAATTNTDELAHFSSYGVRSVNIAAPGFNVFSTIPGTEKYASYSGTSMACPHVSGAAALLLGKEPSLNYAEVKARITNTADKVRGLRKKVTQGNRLNVYNMVMNIIPPGPVVPPESSWSPVVPQVIESEHNYKDGITQSWTVSHPGATHLRIKFGKFDTEQGYDVVTIKSAKTGEIVDSYSGPLGDKGFVTSEIEGDQATIEFKSDSSINKWGFLIEGYSWTSFNGGN